MTESTYSVLTYLLNFNYTDLNIAYSQIVDKLTIKRESKETKSNSLKSTTNQASPIFFSMIDEEM